MKNENLSQTESLLDIVKAIEKYQILLPEFQRDFRWEMDQTYDLFDSLIRDIFIGTIIYGKPSFAMTLREIDNRPRKGKGSRRVLHTQSYSKDELVKKSLAEHLRIVLDGQQRITSIYRALTGTDTVYVILRQDMSPEDLIKRPLEEILSEVTGEESASAISVKLHDAYQAETESLDDPELDAIFEKSEFFKARSGDSATIGQLTKAYRRAVKKLIDLFKEQKLVAFYLLDMTLDKFCTFFERSNSRGLQLDFTDILAAKLYKGFNLREKFDEFADQNSDLDVNRETIIRTIAYFSAVGKKAAEKRGAIEIGKKSILDNLEPEDFNTHWYPVTKLYRDCLDHLVKQRFVLNHDWLPSENMVIPLMVFLSHVKGFDRVTEEKRKFIEYWFWSSVFSGAYVKSSTGTILTDAAALTEVANGARISKRDYFTRLRSRVTDHTDLFSYTKGTSAIYKGVLNLIGYANPEGLRDWTSKQLIDANKPLDDHHIYPRAYIASCKDRDLDDPEAKQLVDCVVNRTLIPKNLNIKIGKRTPNDYLGELKKKNSDLADSLRDHLIPTELISDPSWNLRFQGFLDLRAAAIMRLIDRYAIQPAKDIESQYLASSDAVAPVGPSNK